MPRLNDVIAALRRRSLRQEGGFTVTELAAAFAILLLALTALARTATVAFSDTAFARQRQAGNQIANQLLEQVRALPYDTLKRGLSPTDLSGDPNIVTCSGVRYFRTTCPAPATAERILTTGTTALPTASPLVPHRGTIGPPTYPVTYSWGVYVTEAKDVPSKGAYRVTALVSWSAGARAGAKRSVETQTLIYSPEGCADTSTHPFAAPCQPFLSASGSVGGGGWATTGSISGTTFGVAGSLLSETADLRVEQVARVEGNVTLPQVSRTINGVETVVLDGAASGADSDPSTSTTEYERETAGPQAPGSASLSDGTNSLVATVGGGSQVETISTTAAGGANSCNLQVGNPCGYASGAQTGSVSGNPTLSMLHTLTEGTAGTATLVSVGQSPSTTPITTYARRQGATGSDPGLVREQISWILPEIRIGGIPSGINAPGGWEGYWVRLRDFTATATAEAGTGTVAPTVSITGGTIDAWKGGSYDSFSVSAYPDGGTIPVSSLVQTQTVSGKQRRVDIGGTVSVGDSIEDSTVLTGTTRTEAEATIASPLVVDLTYAISIQGSPSISLDLSFTAGTGIATAQYVPAG